MKPTSFNPAADLPPIPFEERHLELAWRLKQAGLPWRPHVGCFVWDREEAIPVPSPFPGRVYFILNLGHFLRLLGSEERMTEKLVWLPTWHQARLAAETIGVEKEAIRHLWQEKGALNPGEDLLGLYGLLLNALRRKP
jgi:hypothetical protein